MNDLFNKLIFIYIIILFVFICMIFILCMSEGLDRNRQAWSRW
ncbi:putative membrane protein [Yersinia pestis PY-13]|uniref:Membrane protein n=1 Tax=Yersinia pestis PY-08 TaxID=992134 RepID=A0AB72ZI01_YERPE|nr:putative membrane protein [Yersinia pestis PY-01]EIQ87987.1 putative membrane protein [Yersinia pestis PY-03]EIQ99944.1 putative membrane protein [Yersinia pestis PY-04]EIR01170.1 putative membrane protein [Yersinia pestis PY-05]EIR04451.1 putative membrane protein [Yersinia pestis PY-06]EIR15101.1 putative membrane protein [Yersinia pestis PY-07]EIR16039.1 putative membrane protein [Yersinia pestis PY-08]EIR18173.1 putative membrane protein [Yersinia pestis PY-09]EIR29675.1 putative mem